MKWNNYTKRNTIFTFSTTYKTYIHTYIGSYGYNEIKKKKVRMHASNWSKKQTKNQLPSQNAQTGFSSWYKERDTGMKIIKKKRTWGIKCFSNNKIFEMQKLLNLWSCVSTGMYMELINETKKKQSNVEMFECNFYSLFLFFFWALCHTDIVIRQFSEYNRT